MTTHSSSLTAAAITVFDPLPKQAYQENGFLLRPTVYTKTVASGNTVTFKNYGKAMAYEKILQNDYTLSNIAVSDVSVTLKNIAAADMTDIFSKKDVNYDDMKEVADALGAAIGRRSDMLVVDALTASGTTNTITESGTAGFTYAKFLKLNKFYSAVGASGPRTKKFILIDEEGEEDILNEDKFINSDYISRSAIERNGGSLNGLEMKGYNWIVMGSDGARTGESYGIPVDTGTKIHTAYAWTEKAIGFGVAMDFSTRVDWVPLKGGWLTVSTLKANAVARDPVGIVSIEYYAA